MLKGTSNASPQHVHHQLNEQNWCPDHREMLLMGHDVATANVLEPCTWSGSRTHPEDSCVQVLLMSILDLPFAISPVVTGLMLVLLYGRNGWFAPVLDAVGFNVVFAFPGACVAPSDHPSLSILVTFVYVSYLI